ncbi:MAG TPA: hypothetical protein VI451_21865 [Anaerolineales bacterium]|nr:hypothetical protein [Anaerolineales bacterium]
MNVSVISQIEGQINRLSLNEQLWLMERLAHQIRKKTTEEKEDWDEQLALMAADPDIQHELKLIEAEFASAEMDGLGEL